MEYSRKIIFFVLAATLFCFVSPSDAAGPVMDAAARFKAGRRGVAIIKNNATAAVELIKAKAPGALSPRQLEVLNKLKRKMALEAAGKRQAEQAATKEVSTGPTGAAGEEITAGDTVETLVDEIIAGTDEAAVVRQNPDGTSEVSSTSTEAASTNEVSADEDIAAEGAETSKEIGISIPGGSRIVVKQSGKSTSEVALKKNNKAKNAGDKKPAEAVTAEVSLERAAEIFSMHCDQCHPGAKASKMSGPLSGEDFFRSTPDDRIIYVIRNGKRTDHADMPAYDSVRLSDDEITAIIKYLKKIDEKPKKKNEEKKIKGSTKK